MNRVLNLLSVIDMDMSDIGILVLKNTYDMVQQPEYSFAAMTNRGDYPDSQKLA